MPLSPSGRGGSQVTDGNAGDVLPAAAATDDLDGMGLDDGHFLGPLWAAVAVDGDFASRESHAGGKIRVLGVGVAAEAVSGFLSGRVVGIQVSLWE